MSRQTLVFLEVQKIPIVPLKVSYIERGSLKYEFSTEILQTPLQLIKVNNVQAQVKSLPFIMHSVKKQTNKQKHKFLFLLFFQIVDILNHLVVNNVEKVHEDAPLKFLELIQVLRAAHLADLEMLWTQYKDRPAFRFIV